MKAKRTPGAAAEGLRQVIQGFGSKRLRVGFFETARYEDGTPVAYVASIHEWGSPPIPPRPFMRPTAAREKPAWDGHLKAGAAAVARGDVTAGQVLEQIGQLAAGDISKTISQITEPPLTRTTLLARKAKQAGEKLGGKRIGELHAQAAGSDAPITGVSTKPLVFDGILISSVTFEVDG